jgi:hypothetical protein
MRQVNHNISTKLTVPSILPTSVSWGLTLYKIVSFAEACSLNLQHPKSNAQPEDVGSTLPQTMVIIY